MTVFGPGGRPSDVAIHRANVVFVAVLAVVVLSIALVIGAWLVAGRNYDRQLSRVRADATAGCRMTLRSELGVERCAADVVRDWTDDHEPGWGWL